MTILDHLKSTRCPHLTPGFLGRWERFAWHGKTDGWFRGKKIAVGGDTLFVASYGSWVTRESHQWYAKDKGELSEDEKQRAEACLRKLRAGEKKAQALFQEGRAVEAATHLDAASLQGLSHYLHGKGLRQRGLFGCALDTKSEKALEYGPQLLVPGRDFDRKLWTIQRISERDGRYKFLLKGEKKDGCFHLIVGNRLIGGCLSPSYPGPIVLSEGIATAASLSEVRSLPVLSCFDAGNMVQVAKSLRKYFPENFVIVAADNDEFTLVNGKKQNPGILAGQAALGHAGRAIIVYPTFSPAECARHPGGQPTDWNDAMQLWGVEEMRSRLLSQLGPHGISPEILGNERGLNERASGPGSQGGESARPHTAQRGSEEIRGGLPPGPPPSRAPSQNDSRHAGSKKELGRGTGRDELLGPSKKDRPTKEEEVNGLQEADGESEQGHPETRDRGPAGAGAVLHPEHRPAPTPTSRGPADGSCQSGVPVHDDAGAHRVRAAAQENHGRGRGGVDAERIPSMGAGALTGRGRQRAHAPLPDAPRKDPDGVLPVSVPPPLAAQEKEGEINGTLPLWPAESATPRQDESETSCGAALNPRALQGGVDVGERGAYGPGEDPSGGGNGSGAQCPPGPGGGGVPGGTGLPGPDPLALPRPNTLHANRAVEAGPPGLPGPESQGARPEAPGVTHPSADPGAEGGAPSRTGEAGGALAYVPSIQGGVSSPGHPGPHATLEAGDYPERLPDAPQASPDVRGHAERVLPSKAGGGKSQWIQDSSPHAQN